MRYLLFVLLFLSSLSFSQTCPVGFGEAFYCRSPEIVSAWISKDPPSRFNVWGVCPVTGLMTLCYADNVQCTPPTAKQANGDGTHRCGCAEGHSVQTVNGTQVCAPDEPPPACPDGASQVYDPSTGQMVCPTTENGSSSSTSSFCLVPGDHDGDCVPDDEQNSSAATTSSPTSTPASTPNTSSPTASTPSTVGGSSSPSTGGGGDDDGNPSTGGGGGGGGGGNSGGGSGSAAASSSPSGSNSSWTPNSGYGNWIPVNPNSPCPNKYQDKDGQWWCWGGQSNSAASNSAGSAGSASSGANSSSPYGGGGECDDEPVCPEGDIECLQFIQQWHTRCGGEKIDSKFFEMEDQGDAEASFSKSFTNFKTELEKLPNTQHIQNFFQFNASGSCPVWQVSVWVFDVVIDQQCSSDIPWDLIAGVIIAVSVLLAARIALT